MTDGYENRDRFVAAICNFLLRHVASRKYQAFIEGAIRYGMNAAARDVREGRPSPQPFWKLVQEAPDAEDEPSAYAHPRSPFGI